MAPAPQWKKARILWNPSAGRGRSASQAKVLAKQLESFADSTEFVSTEGPDHLIRSAAEARAQQFDLVWIAGGDGSVHLAARGLLENGIGPIPHLGILPLGSANDLAFGLDLKADWWKKGEAHAAVIDHGWIRCGQGPEIAFVNGAGLGINAMVTIRSRKISFVRGLGLYTLALLQALVLDWTRRRWHVCLEGRRLFSNDDPENSPASHFPKLGNRDLEGEKNTERASWLALSVMNGRREGNFDLAPMARLNDGKFELLAVRDLSRLRALTFLPSLLVGGLGEKPPWLTRYRGKELTIKAAEDLAVHADGELLAVPGDSVREVSIRLQPLGLPVLVGPRFES